MNYDYIKRTHHIHKVQHMINGISSLHDILYAIATPWFPALARYVFGSCTKICHV